MRDAARRVIAGAWLVVAIAYPVRAFFVLEGLPWAVKALWALAALGALASPRASLLAFLAGAPLTAIVPALFRWPSVSLASAWLWALLAAAWLRMMWRPPRRCLPVPATLLLLIATASLVVGLYPLHLAREGIAALWAEVHAYMRDDLIAATSQRPVMSPVLAWVTLAEGIGLLWLACLAFDRARAGARDATAEVSVALAAGAGAVGAWAIVQWWTRENLLPFWVEQDPYITRVNASFTDVNALGAYLASSVALVAAVAFLSWDRRWRAGWLLASALVLIGTVFTGSRIAWASAGFAIAGLVLGVLCWRLGSWSDATDRTLKRSALAGLAIVVTLLVVTTWWATSRDIRHDEQRSYLDTVLYTLNLRAPMDERLKGRLDLWWAAVSMTAARPWTGIGLGRYFKDLAAWAPDADRLARPQENAHNYFLQTAAELGLPGLVCVLWLFGRAILNGLRRARAPGLPGPCRVSLAAALGVAAFALTCLTGHSLLLREGQLTFWALAGLALAAPTTLEPAASRRRERIHGWLVAAAALILLALMPLRMRGEVARAMNRDLTRDTVGLYEEEISPTGHAFRWTGARAAFHVPADARVITVEIRSLAPVPQTVRVYHAGHLIEQVAFHDQGWRTLRFVSPLAAPRQPYRRFELRVEPTWYAPGDPRELGVMLGAVAWTR